MSDLFHYFGGDLNLSATGGLLTVDGLEWSKQRVLRRLLTNPAQYDASGNVTVPGDYLWQPDYGAGLPSYIGENLDIPALTALIRAQMYLEASVLHDPEPSITLQQIPNGVAAQITYYEADSGLPVSLSFDTTTEG